MFIFYLLRRIQIIGEGGLGGPLKGLIGFTQGLLCSVGSLLDSGEGWLWGSLRRLLTGSVEELISRGAKLVGGVGELILSVGELMGGVDELMGNDGELMGPIGRLAMVSAGWLVSLVGGPGDC